MAKFYKLMKVKEGEYNVRRASDNGIVGKLTLIGGRWSASALGRSFSKFKSKAKALGFIRGIFAAASDVTSFSKMPEDLVSTSRGSYSSDVAEASSLSADLLDAIEALTEALTNFSGRL